MPLCELCCVRRDGRWVDDEDVGKHCMMILTFVGAVLTCCGIICLLVGIFADFWPDENDIYPGYVYPYPLDTPEHIRNQMTKANGYAIICMGGVVTVIGISFHREIVTRRLDLSITRGYNADVTGSVSTVY